MPHFLDYARLSKADINKSLHNFLITVYGNDGKRRAIAAFPEYFTEEKLGRRSISFEDICYRAQLLSTVSNDNETLITETLNWFGLELLQLSGNCSTSSDEIPLPPDFELKFDSEFRGFESDEPWIVSVADQSGKMMEVLVIEIISGDEATGSFFLLGTDAKYINFKQEEPDYEFF